MTSDFLTRVSGGVLQLSVKWFIGFRILICKMKCLTIEKMQTLQGALSSTSRISPFLPDPALLMPVEFYPSFQT